MQGNIKKLMTDKNFGFISQDGGDDLFFHANNLDGVDFSELNEGDAVTFETEETPKGSAAINVKKA
ncbi:cold shock domain-containing protein [Candidatus Falkowbacteria bacterium]|jgi:cold shock protein|nr:cold shock domain-containing protein [Candidatus Falkowbacteria bacterium]MBT4433083.1 cold shock domain-containing protein [Candidatus Falkowbacteria bacterium]